MLHRTDTCIPIMLDRDFPVAVDYLKCQINPSRIKRTGKMRKQRPPSSMPCAFYRPMTSSLVTIFLAIGTE
ncbi:unnamed protein product [Onchocerca flexuosa]|uniref:Uncharacterized protein n=1 Tax=Onchocerca flexuosa TaxID=387005 RepID=A0A183I7A3_9BILA|nr:unnamed protein product [Onchocerca flexuosa]